MSLSDRGLVALAWRALCVDTPTDLVRHLAAIGRGEAPVPSCIPLLLQMCVSVWRCSHWWAHKYDCVTNGTDRDRPSDPGSREFPVKEGNYHTGFRSSPAQDAINRAFPCPTQSTRADAHRACHLPVGEMAVSVAPGRAFCGYHVVAVRRGDLFHPAPPVPSPPVPPSFLSVLRRPYRWRWRRRASNGGGGQRRRQRRLWRRRGRS